MPKTDVTATRQHLLSIILSAITDLSPFVVVASMLINALSLFMPLAIMVVYDRLIPHGSFESLTILVCLVVISVAIEAIFRISRNHLVSWAATKLSWQAQREILRRFMGAPADTVAVESTSRSFDRLQALMTFAEWHGSPSRLVLIDLPFILLYIGLMIAVGQWLAAIPILLFCTLGFTVHRRSTRMRDINRDSASEEMKAKDFLVETLTGLSTIKASAMENQMQRRFERLQQTAAEQSFGMIRLSEETQAITGFLSNLTQMVTVTVGAVFVINGETSVGALACCVMLSGRAIQPLLRCIAVWNELQSVVVGLEKAEPLLKLPETQQQQIKLIPTNGPLEVRFSKICFRHRETSPLLMNEASFFAPAGSIIAISGRDGSGKSTIADMLCGYISNYTGEIRIGNFDPRREQAILKSCVSIVRPGASAIRGSIIDNITMFRRGEDVELAMRAARLIGLDADIYRLPRGYQTMMSEGLSAELPAGLVQRISIARAIARRPGLLILDEANGALDMRSDRALIDGLLRIKGYTTIVIITNRPSLADIADQAFLLDEGVLRPRTLDSVVPDQSNSVKVAH